MANNQKKLKAFVRYDGSGRVVASSLILRKNKPRVGRWFEIPTYECCNGTTTTTTTQGGSGGGPTAWVVRHADDGPSLCVGGGTTSIIYTAESTISTGVAIFADAALTIPANMIGGMNNLMFSGDSFYWWTTTFGNTYLGGQTSC